MTRIEAGDAAQRSGARHPSTWSPAETRRAARRRRNSCGKIADREADFDRGLSGVPRPSAPEPGAWRPAAPPSTVDVREIQRIVAARPGET